MFQIESIAFFFILFCYFGTSSTGPSRTITLIPTGLTKIVEKIAIRQSQYQEKRIKSSPLSKLRLKLALGKERVNSAVPSENEEAYFRLESPSSRTDVTFTTLQARLLSLLNSRINNGDFTERGLARLVGISQPQVHNVLKGARKLNFQTADRFLYRLQLSIFDLITQAEFTSEITLRATLDSLRAGGIPGLSPSILPFEPLLSSRRRLSILDFLADISTRGRLT